MFFFLLKINSHSSCHNQHNGHGNNIGRYFLPLLPFAPTVPNFWKTGCKFYHFNFGGIKVIKGVKKNNTFPTLSKKTVFSLFFQDKLKIFFFFLKKVQFTFIKKLIFQDKSEMICIILLGECHECEAASFRRQIFIVFNAKLYKQF